MEQRQQWNVRSYFQLNYRIFQKVARTQILDTYVLMVLHVLYFPAGYLGPRVRSSDLPFTSLRTMRKAACINPANIS